ncbi:V-type proton ATPase subunit e 2-like [Phymastichus coffea]|uniref:V-type proton ATPase subunit e 2-like n=1 Tax=Phymastichus coffea TaxID=108790 RepID=UPI00273C1568|nr:V-type proton ATPase subunit e 2-like [Phymastichus coffea]
MGAYWVPVFFFTVFWGAVGIVLPFFVPKGPNKGILQVVLMLTAFTCWLFWLCCYMAQMNPLVGPVLKNSTVLLIAREWQSVNPFLS